jgi:hypothetical protein
MTAPLNVIHGKELKAWQQQDNESALHYLYYKTYQDLGPQRSILETVQTLVRDDQIKRTPDKSTLTTLQRENRWQYRAELWDRYQLATQTRFAAEQRREEMRIGLQEYAEFQNKLGRGLSALAAKVLQKTDRAITSSTDADWDIATASRFMQILNNTAQTASGLWSDSLGVERLNQALSEMDAKVSQDIVDADEAS